MNNNIPTPVADNIPLAINVNVPDRLSATGSDLLTIEEVNEVSRFLDPSGQKPPTPAEAVAKVDKVKPCRGGYFTEERRLYLLSAKWVVENDLFRAAKDKNGNPCVDADQYFRLVGLGDHKAVSKALQTERLFQLLPDNLKDRVRGPGCLEPLLPLVTATEEKRQDAFEALKNWTGKITKSVSRSVMATQKEPQVAAEIQKVIRRKVEDDKTNSAIKSLGHYLTFIPATAARSYSAAVVLLKAMAADFPNLVPKGQTCLSAAEPTMLLIAKEGQSPASPSMAPVLAATSESPADHPVAAGNDHEPELKLELKPATVLAVGTEAPATSSLAVPCAISGTTAEPPAAVPAVSVPKLQFDLGLSGEMDEAASPPPSPNSNTSPHAPEPSAHQKAALTWQFPNSKKVAYGTITNDEIRIVITGAQGRAKKTVLGILCQAGFTQKTGLHVWTKPRGLPNYDEAANQLDEVMRIMVEAA